MYSKHNRSLVRAGLRLVIGNLNGFNTVVEHGCVVNRLRATCALVIGLHPSYFLSIVALRHLAIRRDVKERNSDTWIGGLQH